MRRIRFLPASHGYFLLFLLRLTECHKEDDGADDSENKRYEEYIRVICLWDRLSGYFDSLSEHVLDPAAEIATHKQTESKRHNGVQTLGRASDIFRRDRIDIDLRDGEEEDVAETVQREGGNNQPGRFADTED